MPQQIVELIVPGTRKKMIAKCGQNINKSWWVGIENKDTKNIRYIKKSFNDEQLAHVLAAIVKLGAATSYLRKNPTAKRPQIIKYLREVITI
jgi:hypothetical protein